MTDRTQDTNSNEAAYGEKIIPTIDMPSANEEVDIYSGIFVVEQSDKQVQLEGTLKFTWFPGIKIKFSGKVVTNAQPSFNMLLKVFIKINGEDFSEGWINSSIDNHEFEGQCTRAIIGNRLTPVNRIRFIIPNMREYLGEVVKEKRGKQAFAELARLRFENDEYSIVCDKLYRYTDRHKKLQEKGGYMILYAGQITSKKGLTTYEALTDLLYSFNHLLYFINGSRSTIMFMFGQMDEQIIWKDYSAYIADPYKVVESWSETTLFKNYNDIWVELSRLWKDANDRDFLETAIHWYLEANRGAAYVEGSIILVQTALELICNWLLVEKKQIIAKKNKLSAAEIIRQLLGVLTVSSAVPPALTGLAQIQDFADGPEALTTIRNALVHGNKQKRSRLLSLTIKQKHECLQLGLWYIELSLLYILNYKGNYYNRVSGRLWKDDGQSLPWNII